MKIKIFFLNFMIFEITSLYFSIKLIKIDDCIKSIYRNKNGKNSILFESEDCNFEDHGNTQNIYRELVKNEYYEYGDLVYINAKNNGGSASMNIIIQIDEYIISTCPNDILKCINCQNLYNYCNNNEFIMFLDNGHNANEDKIYYYFYFQINSFNELNSNKIGINHNFYALAQKKYLLSVNYQEDEIELINFKNTDNFYIADNNSLPINYTNYYFKIYSINQFSENLIGLNLSNSEIKLKNNDSFIVTESKGLRYRLSPQEKKDGGTYINFKIRAYNFPNNIYYSEPVSQLKEFFFIYL